MLKYLGQPEIMIKKSILSILIKSQFILKIDEFT